MSYYGDSTEDSFEDFLEWRKFKRERRRHKRQERERYLSGLEEPDQRAYAIQAAPSRQAARAAPRAAAAAPRQQKAAARKQAPSSSKGKGDAVEVAGVSSSGVSSGKAFLEELANASNKSGLRQAIQAQADEAIANGSYQTADGTNVELPSADIAKSTDGTKVYSGSESWEETSNSFATTAHFVKADAIETALFLKDRKSVNPVVLIPADNALRGGGNKGVDSLEEQLYRRTTAGASIPTDYKIPQGGAIYSPDVLVYRDSEQKSGYAYFKAPRKVSFILASSERNPKYETKGRTTEMESNATEKTKATLRTVLRAALKNGHDAIVIPAFGCGYNANPPAAVAAIFRDLLTSEFSNMFKHVTFSIIEDGNTNKSHNLEGNLRPFQQEFLTVRKAQGQGCC